MEVCGLYALNNPLLERKGDGCTQEPQNYENDCSDGFLGFLMFIL